MVSADRLFFVDLDLNAILDIQPKVDYIHFNNGLEMFDKKAVELVLTEPHVELNKWIEDFEVQIKFLL